MPPRPTGQGQDALTQRCHVDERDAGMLAAKFAIGFGQNSRRLRLIRRAEVNRSEEVRDFYERMPYPAPLTNLDEHRNLYKNQDRRRAEFHLMWPAKQPRANQEILIAGCGTSQAATVRAPRARCSNHGDRRQRHEPAPHARSSAQVQSGESRTASTPDRARPGDWTLFRPGGLHRSAASPARPGLRSSRPSRRAASERRDAPDGLRTLRPGRNLYDAGVLPPARNQRVGERIYEISAPQSKHCRRTTRFQALLRRAADFRRPEAMADALLHPQDRAYTVPELYAWLDRCGMSFGRWIEQAPYLAQCGAVARSPHAARLASLPSRLQHAAVELFRGTMVSHSFIAYRDDRSDDEPADQVCRRSLARLHSHCTAMDGVRSGTSASW